MLLTRFSSCYLKKECLSHHLVYVTYKLDFIIKCLSKICVINGVAEQQCFLNAVVHTIVFTERKVKVKLSLTSHEDSEVGRNVGLPTVL
jgi:hypothetical protein